MDRHLVCNFGCLDFRNTDFQQLSGCKEAVEELMIRVISRLYRTDGEESKMRCCLLETEGTRVMGSLKFLELDATR